MAFYMRRDPGNPCFQCVAPKRHPGCHGTCQEHRNWKDLDQKKKEYARGVQKRERMLNDFYSDGCIKAIKKSGGKV